MVAGGLPWQIQQVTVRFDAFPRLRRAALLPDVADGLRGDQVARLEDAADIFLDDASQIAGCRLCLSDLTASLHPEREVTRMPTTVIAKLAAISRIRISICRGVN